MGWTTGVGFPEGDEPFSSRHRVQTGSGAHPASYAMGNVYFFDAEKRPEREADHSPPYSSEIKNKFSWRGSWLSTGTTLPLPIYIRMDLSEIGCECVD
jgi:hypothetical protein